MATFEEMIGRNHEQVSYFYDEDTGLRCIIGIHNTILGPGLGGCRIWNYNNEEEALIDVLRLSRGMTYKAAIAGLNLGGAKAVIFADKNTVKSEAYFRSFGKFVEAMGGRYITAEDVGTTENDMELVRQKTSHVTGVSKEHGGSGDPSPVTAYGTYIGIQASVKYKFNLSSLEGLKILVQGIGSVGMHLIEHLSNAGAEIFINDIDKEKIEYASKKYNVKPVETEKLYNYDCDIYAPCALGATVNDLTIDQLKCKIIAGAANNILLDPKKHSIELMKRDILFAPDYVINAGGLINVANEIDGYNENKVKFETEKIYDTLLNIFKIAVDHNISTSEASRKLAEKIISSKNKISEKI